MSGKLIIIGGYCGAGKSSFARKLSKEFRIPCYIKDSIKETMADSYGEAWSVDNHKKGSVVAVELMLHLAENILKVGSACILEANFRPNEGERMKALIDKYCAKALTFIFDGDLERIYKRYVSREKAGNRHWVHLVSGETKASFIEGQLKGALTEVSVGKTIHIDASVVAEIDFKELLNITRSFMQDS